MDTMSVSMRDFNSTHGGGFAAVESKLKDHADRIKTLEAGYSAHHTRLESLEGTRSAHKTAIASMGVRLRAHAEHLDMLPHPLIDGAIRSRASVKPVDYPWDKPDTHTHLERVAGQVDAKDPVRGY